MSSRTQYIHTNKQYKRWQKAMLIGNKLFRCHQLPERSFFFHGMQFPVCARCTGIALGFFLVGPIVSIFYTGNLILSLVLIFLMVQDGLLQLFHVLDSTNFRRLITGLGFGYGTFSLILFGIIKIIELF